VLITDHDNWPAAEVIAAHRSQSEAEFGFRQLKDPHVVSFSPMFCWTDHNIRVHTFTCVLALQLAHLMRREAERAGLVADEVMAPTHHNTPAVGLSAATHCVAHRYTMQHGGTEETACGSRSLNGMTTTWSTRHGTV
jgi:transposase